MAENNWIRIKDIVDEAIRRKPEERSAYLEGACGDDAEVRREVESLSKSFVDG